MTPTPDPRDALITALGGLIAHLHVPRSMGSIMVPEEYDTVRALIRDFGYSSADEIADRLRAALAAQPAPPLDVERLAEAIDVVAVDADNNEGILVSSGNAGAIAAEYNRLAAEYTALSESKP